MNDAIYEMGTTDFVVRVLKKWKLMLVVVILAVGCGYYVTKHVISPTYEATSTVLVLWGDPESKENNYEQMRMSREMAVDFALLTKSDSVLNTVINEMRMNATADQIRESVDVNMELETNFINISYCDSDAKMAASVANKISEVLTLKTTELGSKRSIIVNTAAFSDKPINPNLLINLVLSVVAGIVVSLAIIVYQLVFLYAYEKEEEVEKELGFEILGVIPKER